MRIKLTQEEDALYKQVGRPDSHDKLVTTCNLVGRLTKSLLARHAIPVIRWQYFDDPKFNIGNNKSRKAVFESNGTTGDAIYYHGNFIEFLRYFIDGPELPTDVVNKFSAQVKACQPMTSGDLTSLVKTSRQLTRQIHYNPHMAADEFFKLALECGLAPDDARAIRDGVRTIR
jgi:hypothetical protein